MPETKSSSNGVGFCGLLTIVFITLKLCHVINWSWWWVLSPVWITACLVLVVLAIVAILHWLSRPRTPAEKLAAACNEMAEAIRRSRR